MPGINSLPGFGAGSALEKIQSMLIGGASFGLGAAGSYKLMQKLKLGLSWKKILATHGIEMEGWEEEAEKIFANISKMSPSIAMDASSTWYLIKNIKMSGGISYPVSRKLLDLESGVPELTSAWPGAMRDIYTAHSPELIKNSEAHDGGLSANYRTQVMRLADPNGRVGFKPFATTTRTIPKSTALVYARHGKTPNFFRKMAPVLKGGLALGAISPLLFEGYKGAKRFIDRSRAWRAFENNNKNEVAGWEDEAKEYFSSLSRYLPELANDNDTALSFIKHMRDQGGIDFSVMTDLLTTSKGLAKHRSVQPHLGYLGNLLSSSLSQAGS